MSIYLFKGDFLFAIIHEERKLINILKQDWTRDPNPLCKTLRYIPIIFTIIFLLLLN